MIGTDAHAHTFPGATTPFGMVQLSPSNDFKAWDWCSGYHYSDSILKGFAHTHISGAGLAGLGDILLMPTTGTLRVADGTEEHPEDGFRSRFSHDREEASAGYYSVVLDDYDVKVELTTTPRVGFHRYTYNKAGKGHIILDPTHHIMENLHASGVEFISANEIRGFKRSNGEAGLRNVYFHAKFSKNFEDRGIAINDTIVDKINKANDKEVKAFVSFNVNAGEQIEVRVALSFVSYEGAKVNFDTEARRKTFQQALEESQTSWASKMDKFVIETDSVSDKQSFYSAVYRSMISPNLISDVTGEYIVEGKKYQSNFKQYSNFSTWDTYRALHPLLALVEQDNTVEFVNSLTSRYTDAKVGLPVWECLGHDNVCMIGHSTVSVMTDAIMKNLPGIDVDKAYEAMRDASFILDKHSNSYDVSGMNYYIDLGFVPAHIGSSVSKTTEYNYFDWCIGQVANKLQKQEDVALFQNRSKGYRNLFDDNSKYFLPLLKNGNLINVDRTQWEGLIHHYVSGNIWGYSGYVPHDMGYLIERHGGQEPFANWLDSVFNDDSEMAGGQHVDISGFIGKYGHGDEPSNQMPYLYTFAGQPWKTQALVRKIMPKFYRPHPAGLDNNDDLGQMASWYVFSSFGFYPVCPGSNQYQIGSPAFKKASLRLENGKTFTVQAKNNSKENIFIQSATLNGIPFYKPFLTYEQIKNGGELVFEMGNTPNKSWGNSEADLQNMIGMQPEFEYQMYKDKQALTPYTSDTQFCFEENKTIRLQTNTLDAEILYTLDGSEPTLKSKRYLAPILINDDTSIKAKAFKANKKESLIFEANFYKGLLYSKEVKDIKVYIKSDVVKYGDPNGIQLVDGALGSTTFNDGQWTGIDIKDFVVTIDLGIERTIKAVRPGFLVYPGAWIFNPSTIEIEVSKNNKDFKKVATYKPITPIKDVRYVERPLLKVSSETCKYLKITFTNGPMPEWHVGGGRNHWIFIDEISVQ